MTHIDDLASHLSSLAVSSATTRIGVILDLHYLEIAAKEYSLRTSWDPAALEAELVKHLSPCQITHRLAADSGGARTRSGDAKRKLHDRLSSRGYGLHLSPNKTGPTRQQGATDVVVSTLLFELAGAFAAAPLVDEICLIAGDSDFKPCLQHLLVKRPELRVCVVANERSVQRGYRQWLEGKDDDEEEEASKNGGRDGVAPVAPRRCRTRFVALKELLRGMKPNVLDFENVNGVGRPPSNDAGCTSANSIVAAVLERIDKLDATAAQQQEEASLPPVTSALSDVVDGGDGMGGRSAACNEVEEEEGGTEAVAWEDIPRAELQAAAKAAGVRAIGRSAVIIAALVEKKLGGRYSRHLKEQRKREKEAPPLLTLMLSNNCWWGAKETKLLCDALIGWAEKKKTAKRLIPLQQLWVHHTAVDDAACRSLGRLVLHAPLLTELHISDTPVTAKGVREIMRCAARGSEGGERSSLYINARHITSDELGDLDKEELASVHLKLGQQNHRGSNVGKGGGKSPNKGMGKGGGKSPNKGVGKGGGKSPNKGVGKGGTKGKKPRPYATQ